jgi:hypothetical protein
MSEKTYKAAKYIRLSYTDDKENESDSVANQRKLIDSFIESQPDIEAVSERVDDGVSGIIFDRKDFKEMMADIEAGKINCVIVKDAYVKHATTNKLLIFYEQGTGYSTTHGREFPIHHVY